VEKQLSDRWSLRAEVLWTKFADQNLANPVFNANYVAHSGNGGAVNFRNDITTASLGLNYRLGAAPAPVPRARTFDSKGWEGFYVGGSLGASWLHSSPNSTTAGFTNVGPGVSGGSDTAPGGNATNIAGGLQFGHNWQANKFVYGFETDLKWLGGKSASSNGSVTTSQLYGTFQYSASTLRQSKVEALSTFRARFGYDLAGTLPYVTGGVAVGRIKSSWNFTGPVGIAGTPNFAASRTSWVPGVTVGGGVEKKLSDHWSVRGEVLWTKFADQTIANPVFNAAYASQTGTGGVINFRNDITTATLGLNYRF
jgi:outer membrane immunogenic protein